ncbi:HNH endonuclease [Mesorhizobium waimense]|uniref:HNH endonuclease n=1 Tax=Mesorhizobium waimense TaxID=1300307 RepID=A0A3A5JUA5_9HYPH|nr:HNH endonuclease signature motif containing protein [Mesorhizobium waimense]RJT26621.1 HNH endonuclease [Mesorhizobium waimense]
MKKKLKFNSAKVRNEMVDLQGGKCCYCRQPFTETGPKEATLEHKKAKMHGGTNARANLAAACWHCNQHRGSQMNATKLRKEKAKAARLTSTPQQATGGRQDAQGASPV